MKTTIRRWVDTDTGHRIPNHKVKCCNLHGHRYRWEAEVEGDTVTETGVSDEGMVIDFADINRMLTEHVHDVIDHAFVVWEGDETTLRALKEMGPEHHTVMVPLRLDVGLLGCSHRNVLDSRRMSPFLSLAASASNGCHLAG